jgi:hypothetical protein
MKNLNNKIEATNLKNAVISKLVSWGNNPNDVKEMVNTHYEYAAGQYKTIKTIAECIRSIA